MYGALIYIYIYIYIHIFIYAYKYAYIYMHIYLYIHIDMYIYIYMHIYMYTYIYIYNMYMYVITFCSSQKPELCTFLTESGDWSMGGQRQIAATVQAFFSSDIQLRWWRTRHSCRHPFLTSASIACVMCVSFVTCSQLCLCTFASEWGRGWIAATVQACWLITSSRRGRLEAQLPPSFLALPVCMHILVLSRMAMDGGSLIS